MKNILLPTDFSENSWNAIKYALDFYKEFSCNFYVLHVNRVSNMVAGDTPYVPSQQIIDDVYTKPSKMQLRGILKRIAIEFDHNDNHKFFTLTDYDFFIDSLRKHVEDKKIDMIVMGTKGASGLAEHILGTNTGDVITKVKCATLAVPENAKYEVLKEVAFPTDFSLKYGIETLDPLYEIIKKNNSSLRVLHIRKKDENLNSGQKESKDLLEDYFSDIEYSFHFLTNKKIENAVQCFVESRDVNMIFMVAKNLNYFQKLFLLPTVEEISYHTHVPFFVVHE